MFDTIRKHVPSTRTLSDGHLVALIAALGVFVYLIADEGLFWMALIGVGVWYAVRHTRAHRAPLDPRTAVPEALRRTAEAGNVPERAPATLGTQATLDDPLVARAAALLRRVDTRG